MTEASSDRGGVKSWKGEASCGFRAQGSGHPHPSRGRSRRKETGRRLTASADLGRRPDQQAPAVLESRLGQDSCGIAPEPLIRVLDGDARMPQFPGELRRGRDDGPRQQVAGEASHEDVAHAQDVPAVEGAAAPVGEDGEDATSQITHHYQAAMLARHSREAANRLAPSLQGQVGITKTEQGKGQVGVVSADAGRRVVFAHLHPSKGCAAFPRRGFARRSGVTGYEVRHIPLDACARGQGQRGACRQADPATLIQRKKPCGLRMSPVAGGGPTVRPFTPCGATCVAQDPYGVTDEDCTEVDDARVRDPRPFTSGAQASGVLWDVAQHETERDGTRTSSIAVRDATSGARFTLPPKDVWACP